MKTNIVKYIFFAIVIILIILAIYILYKDGNKKEDIIGGVRVDVNIDKEINIGICKYDTINPILSNNRDVQYIDKLIYDSLVSITSDFKIENKLSKEFSKINDKTYIVKLKDDIYWHDGERFTAKDVIFTVNSLKNNNINSIYKENVKEIESIEQIDDYTIKIILNSKVDFFEYMMCIPILASHSYNEEDLSSKTKIPIGTGEFRITKIDPNTICLENNNNEEETKHLTINLVLKESANDLYNLLIENKIDLMITDNIDYENYIGSMGYNVRKYQGREFDYLILNNDNWILNNKEIRRGINYAINKNKINSEIYRDKYNICCFPLQYGNYLYDIDSQAEYDINKANDIFVQKGWILKNNILNKNGKTFKLKLLVNNENEKRVQTAKNIKEQLKDVGIIIEIVSVNNYQFNKLIKNKSYDIILTGNVISNTPNLDTFFGDNNLSNYKSEKTSNLLTEIKSVDNQEDKLKEKYNELNNIYEEEMPFISLYFNSIFVLYSKSLKGDFKGNWYNIYYNIDNWYKTK